jgi:hypothetical protein
MPRSPREGSLQGLFEANPPSSRVSWLRPYRSVIALLAAFAIACLSWRLWNGHPLIVVLVAVFFTVLVSTANILEPRYPKWRRVLGCISLLLVLALLVGIRTRLGDTWLIPTILLILAIYQVFALSAKGVVTPMYLSDASRDSDLLAEHYRQSQLRGVGPNQQPVWPTSEFQKDTLASKEGQCNRSHKRSSRLG